MVRFLALLSSRKANVTPKKAASSDEVHEKHITPASLMEAQISDFRHAFTARAESERRSWKKREKALRIFD